MTGDYPLISVIIPTYNRADILPRAINSVLEQTYKNFELIIVDDASSDNTSQLIKSINDTRIKYIRHDKNSNGSVARNTGITNAKGEYIAFLDSDDEWKKEKLYEQFMFYGRKNMRETICYTSSYEIDGVSLKIKPKREKRKNEQVADYLFSDGGLIQTSTLMIHKSILNKVKFNPKLKRHQDWDLCIEFEKHGYSFIFFNKPLTVRYKEDDRGDRISNIKNPEPSIYWINNNKKHISERAYISFMILTLSPLIGDTWKKGYVIKLIKKSIELKSVSLLQLIKFSRFLFPRKAQLLIEELIIKLKRIINKPSKNAN